VYVRRRRSGCSFFTLIRNSFMPAQELLFAHNRAHTKSGECVWITGEVQLKSCSESHITYSKLAISSCLMRFARYACQHTVCLLEAISAPNLNSITNLQIKVETRESLFLLKDARGLFLLLPVQVISAPNEIHFQEEAADTKFAWEVSKSLQIDLMICT